MTRTWGRSVAGLMWVRGQFGGVVPGQWHILDRYVGWEMGQRVARAACGREAVPTSVQVGLRGGEPRCFDCEHEAIP